MNGEDRDEAYEEKNQAKKEGQEEEREDNSPSIPKFFREVRGVGHYRGSHTSFTSLPLLHRALNHTTFLNARRAKLSDYVRRELKIYPLWNWLGSALTRSDSNVSNWREDLKSWCARFRASIAHGYSIVFPPWKMRSPRKPLAKKIRCEYKISWVYLGGVVLIHLMNSMGLV